MKYVFPNAALLRSGVAGLALIASAPAFAADEAAAADAAAETAAEAGYAEAGDAIVVTARRREESSQEVPIALSVVSAETLDRTGNFTINQIQQLVPSLQVTATNPRNSNINIRGLGSNSAVAVDGLEYGVGFYVDGVYYGRPGQSQFDLIDLQQIEVLRGPQGTLFGKNTTAGALNITTRAPSFDPELTVEGSLGNYQYHQIRASGSVPIIADKVAVRLSVSDTHRDGFLTNAYDGSDAQNYDNFNIRGQLLIKPTEDVSIRIIGDYSKQKQHSSLTLIDGYFTNYANGAAIPNNILQRAARLNYTLPKSAYGAFTRVGNSDAPFQANMESYGASGQIDWDLGPATLTSITAYRWWDWYPKNDVDGTALSINTLGELKNFQRQFSQEVRLASNGNDNKIDYVVGLFYFWQKIRGYGRTGYGADFAEWNFNPATVPAATIGLYDYAFTGYEVGSFSNPQTKSYAAFGQADWHITDALTLTAGLRFTHEEKEGRFEQFAVTGNDLSVLTPAQRAQATTIRNTFSPILAFEAEDKADALSGLVTLSYKVAPDVLVYGTYSRGNKSGGLNLTAGGVLNPVVDPEKVDAFELGFKSQLFNNKVTFNAAAFLTEVRDYQTTVSEQIPGTSSTIQYIANIPKARSKGIEADITYSPTRWLTFGGSAAYTDAKFVSYANSPQAAENTNLGAIQDLSGKRLPGVPKFAYALNVDASQPLSDSLDIYARADWLHRSSYNATPTKSIYGEIPAYGLLNARVGVRTSNGKIDFAVWTRNLLDKNYFLTRNGGTFGMITGAVGEPRTIGATLRYNW